MEQKKNRPCAANTGGGGGGKSGLDKAAVSIPYDSGKSPICQEFPYSGRDIFRQVRETVTAQMAAENYGITIDHHQKALCPFHHDHHPSMTFRGGRFRCWSCGASGDAIEFTGKLFGLKPLDATRKLNEDFNLGIPLDKPLSPKEREQARKEAERRREVNTSFTAFQKWREDMVLQLCRCVYLGNFVEREMATLDLSEDAAEALRRREQAEYLADTLSWGSPEDQLQVWKDRTGVQRWTSNLTRLY